MDFLNLYLKKHHCNQCPIHQYLRTSQFGSIFFLWHHSPDCLVCYSVYTIFRPNSAASTHTGYPHTWSNWNQCSKVWLSVNTCSRMWLWEFNGMFNFVTWGGTRVQWKGHWTRNQEIWILFLVLPLAYCGILGKSLKLSVPPFSLSPSVCLVSIKIIRFSGQRLALTVGLHSTASVSVRTSSCYHHKNKW